MLTLPDAFTTAVSATGHEPIWLIELGGVGRFFATHAKNFGRTWRLGEGLYLGGGWRIGERRAAYSGTIAENGLGRITQSLDDTGQSARIGNLTVELLGHGGVGLDLNTLPIDNTPVRVLMGFRDLSYPEYVQLYLGVLDNVDESLVSYLLDIVDDTLRAHRDLSQPIGSLYFPGAPASNRGKAIPILIGRNTDVEALQVIGAAAGTLALTLSSSGAELYLSELGATFPTSGEITVGTETGVTYTARSYVTINGITYLRLEGLTRGSPATQNAGDAVTLTNYVNTYLVGYETGAITAVRDDGVIVDTADYTVTTSEADRTVTVIEFDAAPSGIVTFDADGLNVVPFTGISNGDFETGDETGWTEAGSAALTVTTGSTADSSSVYKGELVGSEDSDETIYNDFATEPNTYYTLEFDYKDNHSGNLVSNADFEDGLTDWNVTNIYNGEASPQGDGGGFNSVSLRAINRGDNNFRVELYQDIATSVAADYTLTFSYLGYAIFSSGGSHVYSFTLGGWRVGSDADDDLYAEQAASDNTWPRVTTLAGRTYREVTVNFTASTTITRITFEALGTQQSYVMFPLLVRDISLVQNTNLPTSTTTYAIGTSSDDDAYATEVLAHRYSWQRIRVAFQALTTITRLSFRSQWFDTSCASHLDNVQIRDGGRNPSDAIAYVIDEFLAPDLERDTSSFGAAFEKLSAWQFGGLLTDPGDSRARIDDMAWQCNSRITVSHTGQLKLLVRDGEPSEATVVINAGSIVDGSFRMRREPIDNVFTDYRIWFGRVSGDTDNPQDPAGGGFQASVSASPTGTTHPSAQLAELCQAAHTVYGSRHVLERRADMIRDLDTAHLLLKALVERHTTRQFDIELRVFHRVGIRLEMGDYAEVYYHRVNGGQFALCEVLAKEVGAADVALRLRTVRDLGVYEPWDFPLRLIEGERFVEPWDGEEAVETFETWVLSKDFKAEEDEALVPGAVTAFVNFNGFFFAGTSEGHEAGAEASVHGQVWKWDAGTWSLYHHFTSEAHEYVPDLIVFDGDMYLLAETGSSNDGEVWIDTGSGLSLDYAFPDLGSGDTRDRMHRFGEFDSELYCCGSDNISSVHHATVWKRTGASTWSKVADVDSSGGTEDRKGIALKAYDGVFYLAVGAPRFGYGFPSGFLAAQIWESNDGTSWSLNHTFSSPFDAIGDLEVFQGKLYASVYQHYSAISFCEREVWEYDGVSWSQSTVIGARTSPSPTSEEEFLTRFLNINDTQLLLGLGGDSFSFDAMAGTWDTGDQRIYTFDGSTWAELVNFGIDNAIVHVLAINTLNDKVYAGVGNSYTDGDQSDYQAKIWVSPEAD